MKGKWIWIALLIGCFLSLVIAKTLSAGFTHDESSTFLKSARSVEIIVTNTNGSANNHILNSLFIKLLSKISTEEMVIRLPNVLAGILYLVSCIFLVSKISRNSIVSVAGLCVLTLNPYLIDFFALARGYGLAIAFMMGAFSLLILFKNTGKKHFYHWSLVLAFLSLYSNFTFISYFIVHIAAYNFILFKQSRKIDLALLKANIPSMVAILLCFAIIFYPVRYLIVQNDLYYGGENGFLSDTVNSLIVSSLYGQQYGIPWLPQAFLVLFLFATLISTIYFLLRFFKNHDATFFEVSFLVAVLLIVGSILQHYILGSKFLINRTALIFYPWFALLFISSLHLLTGKSKNRLFQIIPFGLVGIVMLFHLYQTYNFESYRDWWYDRDTKKVLNDIKGKYAKPNGQIDLGVNWLFHPTSKYYIQTHRFDRINLIEYAKEIDTNSVYDFYYVRQENVPKLNARYDEVRRYRHGILFKAKKPTIEKNE